MANIIGFVGIGVSAVVLILGIVAIAINSWQTTSTIETGLWEACTTVGTETCFDLDDLATGEDLDNLKAVRAMVMLGILLSVGAIVAGILVMFVMKSTKLLFFVAGGLDIAAGLFFMIGMAIFVDKIKEEAYDYGAAFALDIVAWLGAWAAGGVFVAAKMMDKE